MKRLKYIAVIFLALLFGFGDNLFVYVHEFAFHRNGAAIPHNHVGISLHALIKHAPRADEPEKIQQGADTHTAITAQAPDIIFPGTLFILSPAGALALSGTGDSGLNEPHHCLHIAHSRYFSSRAPPPAAPYC